MSWQRALGLRTYCPLGYCIHYCGAPMRRRDGGASLRFLWGGLKMGWKMLPSRFERFENAAESPKPLPIRGLTVVYAAICSVVLFLAPDAIHSRT